MPTTTESVIYASLGVLLLAPFGFLFLIGPFGWVIAIFLVGLVYLLAK